MNFWVPMGTVIGVSPANQLSRFGNCVYTRLLTGPRAVSPSTRPAPRLAMTKTFGFICVSFQESRIPDGTAPVIGATQRDRTD